MEKYSLLTKLAECTLNIALKLPFRYFFFRYFYLFATQLHYLKMLKEKKNVGRDGEEA